MLRECPCGALLTLEAPPGWLRFVAGGKLRRTCKKDAIINKPAKLKSKYVLKSGV